MKKHHYKRTYGRFLLKYACINAVAWFLIMIIFLQIAYQDIFHMVDQRSAINFYESMETIQFLMKDHKLMDERVEITQALQAMSNAGDYYISHSSNPVLKDYGNILGLQLGWKEIFLFWDGMLSYGNNNANLPGIGKGMGFLLDGETDEILFDSKWKEDVQYLYLRNLEDRLDTKSVTSFAAVYHMYYCPNSKLENLVQELTEEKTKYYENLKSSDSYTTEKRLTWRMDEFYVKEDEYYPAKVSLYYVDARDYRTAKEGERYPDELIVTKGIIRDDLSDWEVIKFDPEKYQQVTDGGINGINSGYLDVYERWEPDEEFRTKAYQAILANQEKRTDTIWSSDISKSWSEGNPLLYFLNGEMIFVRTAYFQDITGHTYRACSYQNISELFRMNLGAILGCGLILALALLILAFLTAYIAYLKQKHVFITNEYRTILMDSMAHDLKSPLMAISGYADNLREHVNDEKRDHYAEQIQKSIGYMNDIVMKNLEILKFSKEKQRVVRRRVNVRMLFEEVFSRYQGEISKRALKVSLMGEMMAWGDEALLQKVAENLVTNAVRYTKDGGEISVTFSSHRLLMKNETEIPYEGKLKRLWEPFARGEDSRTGKGTGLGLAIVANVLDRHDWKYRLSYDKETKLFQCEIKIPYGILF